MGKRTLPRGLRDGKVLQLHEAWSRVLPQVYAWLVDPERFRELRTYVRHDGSFLAVAKEYGSDGRPMIAFGSGVDALASFVALEGTIAAGNWKVDKPWEKNA